MKKSKQILIALGAIALVGAVIIIKGKNDKNAIRRFYDGGKVDTGQKGVVPVIGYSVYKNPYAGGFVLVKDDQLLPDNDKVMYQLINFIGKINTTTTVSISKQTFNKMFIKASEGKILYMPPNTDPTDTTPKYIYYKEK